MLSKASFPMIYFSNGMIKSKDLSNLDLQENTVTPIAKTKKALINRKFIFFISAKLRHY
jgi:hypothetical protein